MHSNSSFSFLLVLVLTPLFGLCQVNDNFTDGEFTSNPPWTGDVSEFSINILKQLQLTNTVSGSSYLCTGNTTGGLDNLEWRFYIRQSFSPSSTNYGRVYLVSDQQNLEGSLNGYYLQFGEAGSSDAIELFKQTGLTSASIARGTNAQIANSFTVTIKVLRDNTGLWSLLVDPAAGDNFALEASGTESTYNSSSWFGVRCVYTASNANKFYFDDIYTGPIITDQTPPGISAVNVISSDRLDVDFDETVDPVSAQTLTNYSVNNTIGNPSSAARDGSNLSLVHLAFTNTFADALQNTLTISNVQDLSSNAIASVNSTFIYHAPVVAGYKDVIINEVFPDPSPQIGLPPAEFIELYNTSTKTLELSGWKFTDGTSTGALISYTLTPGSYLILCSTSNISLFAAFTNAMGLTNFPSLNNSGDHLYLKDNYNTLIDSVNYSDTWYQDVDKRIGGWSLELIDPQVNNFCPISANWKASTDLSGGTPGKENSIYSLLGDTIKPEFSSVTVIDSLHIRLYFGEIIDSLLLKSAGNYSINGLQNVSSADTDPPFCVDLTLETKLTSSNTYTISIHNLSDCSGNPVFPSTKEFFYFVPKPHDIVINEIFADPSPQIGLPSAEFIELFNKSTSPVDLSGWKYGDSNGLSTLNDCELSPKGYLILCNMADTALFSSYGKVKGLSGFASLNNSGDRLYLNDNHNTLIDSVNYSDAWYGDATKKEGGWSLELINPDVSNHCSVSSNWKASTNGSGGTPGIQNSIYSLSGDTTKPKLLSAAVIDSLHILLCFDEIIDSSQLKKTSRYSINGGTTIFSAIPDSSLFCVELTLGSGLISGGSYSISADSLSDCSGNIVSPSVKIVHYYIPKQFDVVINEIMADPDPPIGLPDHEYIELYNTTAFDIHLKNWVLQAGQVSKFLPDVSILADSFLVLTSSNASAEFGNSTPITGLSGFPSLTNTGQTLILKNPEGGIISTVSYTDEWYKDEGKKEGGWALEQVDADNPCEGMNNWKASIDVSGGTPGRKNSIAGNYPDNSAPELLRVGVTDSITIQLYFSESLDSTTVLDTSVYAIDNQVGDPINAFPVGPDHKSIVLKLDHPLKQNIFYTVTLTTSVCDCKGNHLVSSSVLFAIPEEASHFDVVINEVLFDPRKNGADFVELYNRSEKVIDLKTLSMSSFDTVSQKLTSVYAVSGNGYLLFPKEYIVLTTDVLAVKDQYSTLNPNGFLQMQMLPAMNISDGTVAVSADTTIIDKFAYTESMHLALLNDTKGVSLERIDFNTPTQTSSNWHSAAESAGFATPAYQNSQYLVAENGKEIKISPEIFSPDNDGFNDVVNISYGFDSPGFVAKVSIFDSKGRLIRLLIKNELLGTQGVFTWDGISDNREKAPVGIYIIYFEIFNLQGEIEHFKNICVLASKL